MGASFSHTEGAGVPKKLPPFKGGGGGASKVLPCLERGGGECFDFPIL